MAGNEPTTGLEEPLARLYFDFTLSTVRVLRNLLSVARVSLDHDELLAATTASIKTDRRDYHTIHE